MFGDALVYGFSLFGLARSARWQATAALVKGVFILVFGLAALGEAAYKVLHPALPSAQTMGIVGALALAANLACFALLCLHRSDNRNMSSTWLCSRNDLVANVGVLGAAALTYAFASRWPDIGVGVVIAGLFLVFAVAVPQAALAELRVAPSAPPAPAPSPGATAQFRPRTQATSAPAPAGSVDDVNRGLR